MAGRAGGGEVVSPDGPRLGVDEEGGGEPGVDIDTLATALPPHRRASLLRALGASAGAKVIVYPGNTQGRNPREAGPRGCYQIDVDTHGRAHLEFLETNIARWMHLELSITNMNTMDQLVDSMLEKAREAQMSFDGVTVARCTIRGNGAVHRDLQRDQMNQELAEVLGSVLVAESVRIGTGPELDFQSLAHTETMVSDFLRLTERALNVLNSVPDVLEGKEPLGKRLVAAVRKGSFEVIKQLVPVLIAKALNP